MNGNRRNKKKYENNFQDEAMEREKEKGEKIQESKNKKSANSGKRDWKKRKSSQASNKNRDQNGRFRSKENDPVWYSRFPQLLKDAGRIPFALPIGPTHNFNYTNTGSGFYNTLDKVKNTTPGIMRLDFVPTVGNASNASDPLNVAGNALFTFVKNNTSATTSFEMPDLMKYILALDTAYTLYSWLRRAYGISKWYSYYSEYVPLELVNSMGITPSLVTTHANDFRGLINHLAVKLSAFFIPKDIYYITRHMWMSDNVFMDSDTSKAQIYYYNPACYLQYEEGTAATVKGSTLYYQDYIGMTSLADVEHFINLIIDPLFGSQDMRDISGYLLRAFGAGNALTVGAISEDYTITPIYSREVLSQIENTRVGLRTGYKNGTTSFRGTIVEDSTINRGYLVAKYGYTFVGAEPLLPTNLLIERTLSTDSELLNMHMDSPNESDIFVATRHMYTGLQQSPIQVKIPGGDVPLTIWQLKSHGTEVCIGAAVFLETSAGKFASTTFNKNYVIEYDAMTDSGNHQGVTKLWNTLNTLMAISKFDWHPILNPVVVEFPDGSPASGTDYSLVPTDTFVELDNFTYLYELELQQLHRVALLSQLCVPSGTYSLRE